MELQTSFSYYPKKVYFSPVPLREELKIVLLWEDNCQKNPQKKQSEHGQGWLASRQWDWDWWAPETKLCSRAALAGAACRSLRQPGLWESKMKQSEQEWKEKKAGEHWERKYPLLWMLERSNPIALVQSFEGCFVLGPNSPQASLSHQFDTQWCQ